MDLKQLFLECKQTHTCAILVRAIRIIKSDVLLAPQAYCNLSTNAYLADALQFMRHSPD